ncbi:uncharacterized protein [Lolium perenne]|uniref:uncharacterized protein n=1 Tax=Lolium perenne TaxID=4522 RepID=UPI0021F686AA|nr:uncharacterized protein LOC127346234 isoform X2 [Lolium perenne]
MSYPRSPRRKPPPPCAPARRQPQRSGPHTPLLATGPGSPASHRSPRHHLAPPAAALDGGGASPWEPCRVAKEGGIMGGRHDLPSAAAKMGLTFTKLFSRLFAKEMRILMVGLDAAGTTTILYKLMLGQIVTTTPTIVREVHLRQRGEQIGKAPYNMSLGSVH